MPALPGAGPHSPFPPRSVSPSPCPHLARRPRCLGLVIALLSSLLAPLPAQPAQKQPPPTRVTYNLPGGVTVEERGNNPKELGVRGPDGQMLIEFGIYHFIWTPPGVGKTILEVRRQSTGSAPRQELRGLYDFAQRRLVLPCEYSEYRDLGAAYLVTRRELKAKAPEKSLPKYIGRQVLTLDKMNSLAPRKRASRRLFTRGSAAPVKSQDLTSYLSADVTIGH